MRLPVAASVLIACSLAVCTPALSRDKPVAEEASPEAMTEGPPALVVAISVDQFSADLFAQYRNNFTGGLARLQKGAVFPSGFQGHAATETCPGHSTLLTGARPSRTGIIANNWFDPGLKRAEKRVYCAEDERDPASSPRKPVVSPWHLKVPTLGERLKQANPASLNVAVSAKDRAVMMMGGHTIDAAYWWLDGAFATFAGHELSAATKAQNNAAAAEIKAGAKAFAVPAWCGSRDRAVQVGDFTIGTGHFPLEPGKADAFRISPRMDAVTVDLAVRLLDELPLGKDDVADVLSVSLSATDYVGHAYGTEGAEMCIQLAELDKAVGRLLAELDKRGIDYVVVLTADHGGLDAPERLVEQAYPGAARADSDLTSEALSEEITGKTGVSAVSGPLLYGDGAGGDIYVSASLNSEQKARVSSALVALLKDHPQVAAVFTAQELAEAPLPSGSPQDWTLKDRARASFYPGRSGDVIVLLDRAVVPIPKPNPGYTATHGSPWDYDRRVPILFWRRGMAGFEQPAPVETVDIAPTLAALLNLAVPDGAFDGRCLDIDGSAANTCEGGD